MGQPVVHFEIGCRDRARTTEFYARLFDWNIQENGPTSMIDAGGGIGGHITALGQEPHHYTIFYIEVDDIQRAYETLVARDVHFQGKPHLIAKMSDHDLWMAFFRDSENNLLGLMSEVPSK